MMTYKNLTAVLVLCGALAATAWADAYGNRHQVNISGATLFVGFFQAPASTNDHIDVDGDGFKLFDIWNFNTPDQLAWSDWLSDDPNNRWIVDYRGVGSGNGLVELLNYNNAAPGPELAVPSDYGLINRTTYSLGGVDQGPADPANPGHAPEALTSIDLATMDVPTTWFVQAGATADAIWSKAPQTSGYGKDPVYSWDSVFWGGPTANVSNKLKTLTTTVGPSVTYNTNTGSPDNLTIFDTEIAWVAIGIVSNQGTGLQNITKEQLQHLYIAGRMPNGENLAAVTRDPGSGTRNGAMNSLGIDPSYGRGDNFGAKTGATDTTKTLLGASHQTSNLGDSGRLEEVVQYNRLAVGYTGLTGSSRAEGDAAAGKYEILNVSKDGGAHYIRPSKNNVLDNLSVATGYQIGGNETFVSVGDPFTDNPGYDMANTYARDYIRNIKTSVLEFTDPSSTSDFTNMPGQYLARNFFLTAGCQALPVTSNPSAFAANPDYVESINAYIKANSLVNIPAFGVNPAGKTPQRLVLTAPAIYSDGTDGSYYIDSHNQHLTTGNLSLRNKIEGDFNYDNQRNINDIDSMMAAFSSPRNFEKDNNNGGNGYVSVEVIGDFNGDGNFDAKDIRYFADGLAIKTGSLKRNEAFTAVDTAWTAGRNAAFNTDKGAYFASETHTVGNFFNTILATGRAYQLNSGWSKADIAGSTFVAPGAKPVGSDGVINAKDIDYLHYILRGGLRAKAFGLTLPVNSNVRANVLDWAVLNDAVYMDLSCDLNGDLEVDQNDFLELVYGILGTTHKDVNLDGVANAADRAIIAANMANPAYTYPTGKAGWADGDSDGDGYVSQKDLDLFDLKGDMNGDGVVDLNDLSIMLADNWLRTDCNTLGNAACHGADVDGDGTVDLQDFALLGQNWYVTIH